MTLFSDLNHVQLSYFRHVKEISLAGPVNYSNDFLNADRRGDCVIRNREQEMNEVLDYEDPFILKLSEI